jgi:DNA helicase-2/ATP-dependent DNA helicase PcrA
MMPPKRKHSENTDAAPDLFGASSVPPPKQRQMVEEAPCPMLDAEVVEPGESPPQIIGQGAEAEEFEPGAYEPDEDEVSLEDTFGAPAVPLPVPAAAPAPPRGSISSRALAASGARPEADYLAGLNPEQRAAVETLDGPVLVLAGAGTGKTRVLTTRIAHILATGRAYPSQILAVTFTNKAAREMRERIGSLIGGAVEGMAWLGTFHSIGVKILRRHAELVGLKSGFTILDTDDQLRLIKQVIEAAGLDKDRWPARQFASLIDSWKNRGLTPDKVPAGEAFGFAMGKGRDLYAAYQTRLRELNACDFGDLLLDNLRIFLEHPDVLADYQRRFKFILVDEYQDTNVAQYLWLRLLAQRGRGEESEKERSNICCVGDDDQSIYGWRGAEVDNILRFDKDFPGATVIRLERNYRSTGHILTAASHLIAHNKSRLGKTLKTEDKPGEKVQVASVWDDEEEARQIGEEIERLGKARHDLNQIAVLVRASFQMRVLEDRFITLGLPYRVIGGPRFYERQEIKDAVAYLEVTMNPANDLKFERIVNTPKRGLGDTTIKRIHELGRARGIPMVQAAREIVETEELTGKARKSLSDLLRSFERWRSKVDQMRHTELAELILDESGYTAMWQADKSPQAHTRLENLKELVRSMQDFESLAGFLEHVSLVMDIEANDDGQRVSIMTLHAAKGLEFDTVFLPGWEEGLFPSQRTLDESGLAGLEEERRLAHVGLTRARKRARLSFAQNRRMRGLYQSATPSRFVDELPDTSVEVIESKSPFGGAYQNFGPAFGRHNPFGPSRFDNARPGGGGSNGRPGSSGKPGAGGGGFSAGSQSTYSTPGWQRAQQNFKPDPGPREQRGSPKSRPASGSGGPITIEGELIASSTGHVSEFNVGERIFHEKFGYGRIAEIDGNKLTINFEKAGQKKVVESFVRRV